MKKKNIFLMALVTVLILGAVGVLLNSRYPILKGRPLSATHKAQGDVYYCPMHPGYISDRPGDCPICNMKLVKKQAAREIEKKPMTPEEICLLHNCPMTNCPMRITGKVEDCPFCGAHLTKGKKVLYYRNPMNPEVTSPVPMKDAMGMDYVPVYEEEEGASKQEVYISPEKQQLMGIKTEGIEKRKLTRQILTVGKVAYDPELYVAQQEYLEALKTREALSGSSIKDQAESLVAAAQRKLMLRGMSEAEIKAFAQESEPQGNLYLPTQEKTAWIYAAVYEYEVGLIKEGLPVELEALAYPSEIFQGKISAVKPVFDPATRATEARIEVEDPAHKLKPQMFVDVRINIDLGEKLAVSEEAVVDSGERTLVFIAKPNGYFEPREVRLGHKAGDYYEVLSGVEEGERVVASGNFFVDSESRLKSVISDTQEHQHSLQ